MCSGYFCQQKFWNDGIHSPHTKTIYNRHCEGSMRRGNLSKVACIHYKDEIAAAINGLAMTSIV